ncbi:MAG: hypothetical protein ABIQ30_06185 [Devosia sp.]
MRILLAALLVAFAALIGAPARAADMPDYPDIEIPDVDYGVSGSFYLRGSAGFNMLWTREHVDTLGCTCLVGTAAGYGYSVGAGFGYETGSGLRFDGTLDYLSNEGLTDGTSTLHLRSTVALANVYYDIPLSAIGGGSAAEGGWGVYVGAGLGGAYNLTHITPVSGATPDGANWSAAAAAMAGVSYDAGTWVADLGYRMIYMPTITNNAYGTPSYYLNDNTIHEVRGTVRHRLN